MSVPCYLVASSVKISFLSSFTDIIDIAESSRDSLLADSLPFLPLNPNRPFVAAPLFFFYLEFVNGEAVSK